MNRDLFKKLWADGLPVAAIAERLGTTPGAVTASRSRLGLPTRGSPIETVAKRDALAERVANGQPLPFAGEAEGLTPAQTDRVWRKIVASLGAQAV